MESSLVIWSVLSGLGFWKVSWKQETEKSVRDSTKEDAILLLALKGVQENPKQIRAFKEIRELNIVKVL